VNPLVTCPIGLADTQISFAKAGASGKVRVTGS